MNATVNRKALTSALKAVAPAVSKGGGLAVLAGVRIEATKAGLDLCCSDIDLTATALVTEATEVTPGVAIPPAALLGRIVEKMAGENVTLALDGNTLTVTSAETVATVRCWAPEDWPQLPTAEGEPVTLEPDDVALIDRIVGMASDDKNRPIITAVAFDDDQIAATDSYRLGVITGLRPLCAASGGLGSALVPAAALRLPCASGEALKITMGDRIVTMAAGTSTWTSRLIEGDYPAYRRLVPDTAPFTLTFATAELAAAIDRVAALGVEAAKGIRIEREGDKAHVTSEDPDLGTVADVIGCRGDFDGVLGFNPHYLADMLTAVDGDDEVTFDLIDAMKPAVVRSGRLVLLLMPTRTT